MCNEGNKGQLSPGSGLREISLNSECFTGTWSTVTQPGGPEEARGWQAFADACARGSACRSLPGGHRGSGRQAGSVAGGLLRAGVTGFGMKACDVDSMWKPFQEEAVLTFTQAASGRKKSQRGLWPL